MVRPSRPPIDSERFGGFDDRVMSLLSSLPVGRRVRVTQQIPHADRVWTNVLEGVVTRAQQSKTGSWYAHAKDDQLWLDRLELRLDDGEITILNLDQYTVIEPV